MAIYVHDWDDYIVINGKTVRQWNLQDYDSVAIHIGSSDALGVYFECNTKKIDGLITADTENYVTFLKGLPASDGSTLAKNTTF